MRVNPIQYAFAYDIPGKLCYVGFPIAVLVWSFVKSDIRLENLKDLSVLGFGLLICVISVPLGLLLAALFICFFLSPFYLAVERMNGGPFRQGDRVYVIAGRNKGEIKEVYSGWQGLAVRLIIGEAEKETFKDVYWSLSLIKVEQAEPEPGAHAEKPRRSG
jgi:hypothetical protein